MPPFDIIVRSHTGHEAAPGCRWPCFAENPVDVDVRTQGLKVNRRLSVQPQECSCDVLGWKKRQREQLLDEIVCCTIRREGLGETERLDDKRLGSSGRNSLCVV